MHFENVRKKKIENLKYNIYIVRRIFILTCYRPLYGEMYTHVALVLVCEL